MASLAIVFFFLIIVSIYFWLCWIFVAAQVSFSLVAASSGPSVVAVAFLERSCSSRALEHRLNSCGARA